MTRMIMLFVRYCYNCFTLVVV